MPGGNSYFAVFFSRSDDRDSGLNSFPVDKMVCRMQSQFYECVRRQNPELIQESGMSGTFAIILGLALFAYALSRVPDRYKPSAHLQSLRTLIGLAAIIVAVLIVITPEFYALGLLGDSSFFDLLVLAVGIQLQVMASRIWCFVAPSFFKAIRALRMRYSLQFWAIIAIGSIYISTVHNAARRIYYR